MINLFVRLFIKDCLKKIPKQKLTAEEIIKDSGTCDPASKLIYTVLTIFALAFYMLF